MDTKSLLGSDRTRTKHLAVDFRTSRVYNAGLIVSVENDERKAECYYCGFIDEQIHIDVHEKSLVKSILLTGLVGKPSIIEMADCAVELVVNSIGKDFIKPSVRIIKIDLCNNNCKTQFKLSGGGQL